MAPGGGAYGLVENVALVVEGGLITWIGARRDLPGSTEELAEIRLPGLVTPTLIDCHTHLIYGGDRAREFEQRLLGTSYQEIAEAGGGILSTVRDTRALSLERLVEAALPRLDALLAEGVRTVEIKSGYGLTIESELRMLAAARALASIRPVRVRTTYLAAHALPPEYDSSERYIDEVVLPGLDRGRQEGLIDAVDGFVESIAFSTAELDRVFERAAASGLPVKLHAEQLSNSGAAQLAASYGALSADHLEYLDEAGVEALATAGTVATLLPGAFYTLRETRLPPIELLRAYAVPMAVATDHNPGSSPLHSLLLAMNMACTLFRMTPEEALAGTTRCAARALGLQDELGTIEVGKGAEFACWNVRHPAELVYGIGANPLIGIHSYSEVSA